MVEEKYSCAEAVDIRLPCCFSSNDNLADFAENESHYLALKNRVHELNLTVPILERARTEEEQKRLGYKYIVRPKFNINGLALMGLFSRYGDKNGNMPLYQNEEFQISAS